MPEIQKFANLSNVQLLMNHKLSRRIEIEVTFLMHFDTPDNLGLTSNMDDWPSEMFKLKKLLE